MPALSLRLPLPLRLRIALFGLAGLAAASAQAADPLTDAITQAYGPYRAALFRTNTNAQAESAEALAKAREAWQQLVARQGDAPPAPFDRDPALKDSLQAVLVVYDKAARQVAAGQLAPAHETLEAVRDLLAELRRRNGVVVYSDHMNAYHAQMERVLSQGPSLLTPGPDMITLAGDAGVLAYLAERLSAEAPESLRNQPEFNDLLHAVRNSVVRLQVAVKAQDAAAAKSALEQLKKPYSQLFLKFG